MKNGPSLEDEKNALLEHIHASRAAYRRMLTEQDEQEQAKAESRLHVIDESPDFPRSKTIRWIMQHPYISAASVIGIVAVAIAAPNVIRAAPTWRTRLTGKKSLISMPSLGGSRTVIADRRFTDGNAVLPRHASTPTKLAMLGRAAITSLVATASMVLRDPSKMRVATRLASLAAGFLSARRARRLQ